MLPKFRNVCERRTEIPVPSPAPGALAMEQLYLNFQVRSEPSAQVEGFGQDGSYTGNGAFPLCPGYQPHITQGVLVERSEQLGGNQPWKSGATAGYWPQQVEAEPEQTETSSTASCCSMDETGTSPGSVGGYGCAYSSGQSDFAETSDMAFVIKDVRTGASASVAPGIPESEADSQDDLERLNGSGDAWLSSVEERDSSEESVPKKYKGRTIFSADQLRVLQQRFQLQRYVTASERQDLGSVIGLTSQQVKTWFQNRRMKMKRALKEPIAVPQTGFLHADLSQNNPVVFGMPSDYMKHQFNGYSLPQLLPRQLAPSPSEQWPSPGSVYPGLGKFQSTVIKSELQYTNQSLNFSIKKEAIALSSRPELEPMKIPVTSYSHGIPVQHFSLQRALSRPGHFQQGLSYEMPKPAGDELHYEKVIIS